MSTPISKPKILVISPINGTLFQEIWQRVLADLRSKAAVLLVNDPVLTVQLLDHQPMPSVILIADEALTLDKYAHVWEAVCRCVRQGSTAVLMGLFSSFVRPLDIKPFFSKAGLPWEGGTYVRTTLTINRAATGDELAARLPPSYSQKAVFIKNVAHSDRWYTTDASSVVESRVFGPSPAHNPGQSPVIMARVGMGRLGYVGDCNAEEETDAVILAMCGLLG